MLLIPLITVQVQLGLGLRASGKRGSFIIPAKLLFT
jgi:hypothetical protein